MPQRTLTIARLERLRANANGNPRWRVTFTDATIADTAPDAVISFMIENSEYRDVPLTVTFNSAGRITNLEPVTA